MVMSKNDVILRPILIGGGLASVCSVMIEAAVGSRINPAVIAFWTIVGGSFGLVAGLYRFAQKRKRRAARRAREQAVARCETVKGAIQASKVGASP